MQDLAKPVVALGVASAFGVGCLLGYWAGASKRQPSAASPASQQLKDKANGVSAPAALNASNRWLSMRQESLDGSDTPRISSLSRANSSDSLASMGALTTVSRLKVLLLVRQDGNQRQLDARQLCLNASKVILQLFKKLYKRRYPQLQPWDRAGGIVVPMRCTEAELMAIMEQAMQVGLPTHSIKDKLTNERKMLAVGPAEAETLHELSAGLKLL